MLAGTSEDSVVSAVRSLNTAEIAYAQAHPATGYTCDLSDLSGAWGISSELARGKKNGYFFVIRKCAPAKAGGPTVKYQLLAFPETFNAGAAAFCSDQSDVIRVSHNGSAEDCLKSGSDLSENEINHPKQ